MTCAAIIGIAAAVSFASCATNVNYNYPHRKEMTQKEAVRLISELGISHYAKTLSGGRMRDVSPISTDQSRFSWVEWEMNTPDCSGWIRVTSMLGAGRYRPYSILFESITNIMLGDQHPCSAGEVPIYEFLLKVRGKGDYLHIDYSKAPMKRDEYLSAFLVLCPNLH